MEEGSPARRVCHHFFGWLIGAEDNLSFLLNSWNAFRDTASMNDTQLELTLRNMLLFGLLQALGEGTVAPSPSTMIAGDTGTRFDALDPAQAAALVDAYSTENEKLTALQETVALDRWVAQIMRMHQETFRAMDRDVRHAPVESMTMAEDGVATDDEMDG